MNKTITASLIHRDSETKVLSLVGHFDVSKFDVREDALEHVFEATQNIEKPWSSEGHRSTSVNDVIVINDGDTRAVYCVAGIGFDFIQNI